MNGSFEASSCLTLPFTGEEVRSREYQGHLVAADKMKSRSETSSLSKISLKLYCVTFQITPFSHSTICPLHTLIRNMKNTQQLIQGSLSLSPSLLPLFILSSLSLPHLSSLSVMMWLSSRSREGLHLALSRKYSGRLNE